jgi:hypothetical protein
MSSSLSAFHLRKYWNDFDEIWYLGYKSKAVLNLFSEQI